MNNNAGRLEEKEETIRVEEPCREVLQATTVRQGRLDLCTSEEMKKSQTGNINPKLVRNWLINGVRPELAAEFHIWFSC